jgi:6-pyruvoyltetrahydropterin/6-carboxytetrahydropterin synthase
MDMTKVSKEIAPGLHSLDEIGRVIDFSVVKEKLCMWLEDNWDHKFLHWENDPVIGHLQNLITDRPDKDGCLEEELFQGSLVPVPFNPTAENMAQYLVEVIGPQQLAGTNVKLTEVLIEETSKCHASYGV